MGHPLVYIMTSKVDQRQYQKQMITVEAAYRAAQPKKLICKKNCKVKARR